MRPRRAAALALIGLLGARDARAADLPSPNSAPAPTPVAVPNGWNFSASAYIWATGLDGHLRTLPPLPAVKVSIGFGEVLQHLDGALMASTQARFDRIVFFTDLIATKLSGEKSFTALGYPATVKLQSSSLIGLASAGYRVVDTPAFTLDGLVGARGFVVDNTIKVQVSPFAVSYGRTEGWVDAVVGANLRYNFDDRWFANAIGFVGGGSAKYEWDAFAGLGYRFDNNWNVFAGYRALRIDYRRGSFLYDALQQGPILGATYRF